MSNRKRYEFQCLIDEKLNGDRVLLPESMLSDFIDFHNHYSRTNSNMNTMNNNNNTTTTTQANNQETLTKQALLTFKLFYSSPQNESSPPKFTHATGFQFTSDAGTIRISKFLAENLGISHENTGVMENQPRSTEIPRIWLEKVDLPNGFFAKISPLEASYLEIKDLRALLESYLRKNHSTLTQGEILSISFTNPTNLKRQTNHFAITELKPEKSVVCVNTDIEVDIVPLDENIAKEAVIKKFNASGVGSSLQENLSWNNLNPIIPSSSDNNNTGSNHYTISHTYSKTITTEGWHYFKVKPLSSRDLHFQYRVKLELISGDADLFISLKDQASILNHDFFNVDSGHSEIQFSINISSTNNSQALTEFISIGVVGYAPQSSYKLHLEANQQKNLNKNGNEEDATINQTNIEESQQQQEDKEFCSNCGTFVPSRTFQMHRAFCERNNIKCLLCEKNYTRVSFDQHWHCDRCTVYGDQLSMKEKHNSIYHKLIHCDCEMDIELNAIGHHRRQECPERLIICRFCHLLSRAGPPSISGKDLILGTNLSEHESECGARTIQCVKCGKNVQLKDVQVHMMIHTKLNEPTTSSKLPPIQLCSNTQCSKPQNMNSRNKFKLCQFCFGPFWSPRIDEDDQRFLRKLTDTYQKQLMNGCGRAFCRNKYCATFRKQKLDREEAYKVATTELIESHLSVSSNMIDINRHPSIQPTPKFFICVNSPSVVKGRQMAEKLMELGFSIEWCIKALMETEDVEDGGDNESQAASWLLTNGPSSSS